MQNEKPGGVEGLEPSSLELARAEHEAVFGDAACPEWVRDSIARYVDHGIPTGDMLRAVLANDLQGAFARADIRTAKAMAAIVGWIYNRVPRNMCGNCAVVDSYVQAKAEARRRAHLEGGSL